MLNEAREAASAPRRRLRTLHAMPRAAAVSLPPPRTFMSDTRKLDAAAAPHAARAPMHAKPKRGASGQLIVVSRRHKAPAGR